MAAKKKQSFEEQLMGVERLISQMESGGMTLEESLRSYEEGMKALAALEKELAEATQKVTVLRKNAGGQDVEIPLEEDL